MAIMAMTTSSSIKVNPRVRTGFLTFITEPQTMLILYILRARSAEGANSSRREQSSRADGHKAPDKYWGGAAFPNQRQDQRRDGQLAQLHPQIKREQRDGEAGYIHITT